MTERINRLPGGLQDTVICVGCMRTLPGMHAVFLEHGEIRVLKIESNPANTCERLPCANPPLKGAQG